MANNTNSEVTYTKLRRRAGDRYCKVSENTQKGWFTMSVPSSPADISETGKALVYLFEVDIPENAEDESSDVMNLQYFFIRTDRALRQKLEARENALFILFVQVNNKNDLFRVISYLYLQSLLRQNMLFYIGFERKTYEVKREAKSIGGLPPLICVERKSALLCDKDGNNCFTFQQFASGKLSKEQIGIEIVKEILLLPSNDIEAAISEDPERLREPFKRNEIEDAGGMRNLEETADVAQRIANILANVFDFDEQQFAAIVDACRTGIKKHGKDMKMQFLEKELNESSDVSAKSVVSRMAPFYHNGESILDSFQWICANYLAKTISGIIGTTEHPIKNPEKSRLAVELSKHILSKKPEEASLLTLLIWFVFLNYMQDNKELFTWNESAKTGGEYELRKERIDKSYLDSREYAEGILQLVENSCQHTQNGVAYLSLRVHHVNRNCNESDLVKVATSRSRLIQRYSKDLKLSSKRISYFPRRLSLEEKSPFYFEIRIADDATYSNQDKDEPRGIPEMYAQNHLWKTDGDKDTSVELCHVFGHRTEYGMPGKMAKTIDESSPDNLKLVTYHYGVRQLQKIVLRNRGSFLVNTPSMKRPGFVEAYSAYSEAKLPDPPPGETWADRGISEQAFQRRGKGWQQLQLKSDTSFYSTEYQILLPIGGAWRKRTAAGDKLKRVKPTDLPIDLSALKDDLSYSVSKDIIRYRDIIEKVKEKNSDIVPFSLNDKQDKITGKEEFVEKTSERLQSELKKELDTKIKLIDFSGISGPELELAVKAFFWTIGLDRLEQNNASKSRRLYAAFFSELSQMQEFILDYSVFCNENEQNPYMENVQIAVCSQNGYGLPEVNFLLAGTSLGAAWKTADIFAYYSNSNNTVSLLPQLQYLLPQETPEDEPVIPFPFDLYLKDYPRKTEDAENAFTDSKNQVVPAPASDCWFMRQMADIINRDLRGERLGCKIEDIHIRLGSKMHIEDFYEAELLFHSLSIVTRFAYLIVQHILSSSFFDRDRPVLLVGYEAYSTILLEYVVKFLSACGVKIANYGLCVHELSGKAVFQPSAALQRADERSEYSEGCNLVTIYPIGTTLSTVYTLIDCVPAHFSGTPFANICVLVVEDTRSDNNLQSLYWTRMPEKPGMTGALPLERSVITLENAKETEEYSIPKVRFFLEAKTIWHAPSECMEAPPEKEKENVLAYVDPTSTIPDTIFPLSRRKNDGPERFLKMKEAEGMEEENYKRIRLLKDCVSYGHIRSGNNHFLYHVDFPLYFEKARKNEISEVEEYDRPKTIDEEMSEWAKKIDPEAYNIIIAPLDPENAAFVQTVADSVFAHSVRIIRVPFQNVRKEDFRAKYSFISEEYRRVNKLNPEIKIHLYFVTMSIVTGATFWRASKLMSMLLEDSGCYTYTEKVFKGIFVLVNRSSPSTIQTMLENPEDDFHAYLHLSVPHFNTFEGICPFCVRHQKIKRFMDDCATNTVLRSFSRMEKKHAVRTPEEHKSWLIDELWHSPGDFSTLCLWLYHQGKKKTKIDSDYEFLLELRKDCLELVNDPKVKKPIRLEDLRDHFADRVNQIERLWLKNIMGERAYLRLYCTHRSFCLLEDDDLLKTSSNDLPKKAMTTIIKKALFPSLDEPQYIEWLISYIKVLSRDYLSKYHYIQEASFKIMITLLCCLLRPDQHASLNLADTEIDGLFEDIVKHCEDIIPLQKYQLIMVLFHQLAEMQANTVIRGDVLFDFWRTFEKLKKDQEELCQKDEYAKLCPLPSDEKAAQDYYRCVKLCLLYGDEENKSLLLQDANDGQSIWK